MAGGEPADTVVAFLEIFLNGLHRMWLMAARSEVARAL